MIKHLARVLVLAAVSGYGWAASAGASPPADPSNETDNTSRQALGREGVDFHDRTRAAIHHVLADPEFADVNADPDAAQRWFSKWLGALMNTVGAWLRHMPGWLGWTLAVWMGLTLLAILGHLIYTLVSLLGGLSQSSHVTEAGLEHPAQLLGLLPLEFDAMYAEACRLLAAGKWLAATQHLYVAAILRLDRQGCISFRLSKTNRDYIEELRTRTALQVNFRWLTGCFESIVYGGQSATMSTTQAMAHKLEELLHESASRLAS